MRIVKKDILVLSMLLHCMALTNRNSSTLTIKISGINEDKGEVQVSLFNSADGFPSDEKKIVRKMRSKIVNGSCTITFDNLPMGEYAVGVFHDRNNNGKLDKNLFGKPIEGIGVSIMTDLGIFNQPKYDKAKFQFIGDREIRIKLTYL